MMTDRNGFRSLPPTPAGVAIGRSTRRPLRRTVSSTGPQRPASYDSPSGRSPARNVLTTERGSLVYVHGGELGLRRERRGVQDVIVDGRGEPVTDGDVLERVRALRIPPAWTDVWIASVANAVAL